MAEKIAANPMTITTQPRKMSDINQTRRQAQNDPHPALHLRGRQQSRLGDTQRSLPLGRVCATLEIVHIVCHVTPDLKEKRNGQRRQRGRSWNAPSAQASALPITTPEAAAGNVRVGSPATRFERGSVFL